GYLEKESVHCIGTVRINRVTGVSMPFDKAMKQKGRESFEKKVAALDGIQLS
ncbi:hypothetical protein HPB47_018176, partial [Ixodes persulcatus]